LGIQRHVWAVTASVPSPQPGHTSGPSPTLFGWLAGVVAHLRLLIIAPVLLAGAAAGISLLLPARYTAIARFYPESPAATGLPAGLASLADRLGFAVGAEARQSTEFYSQLTHTRRVLERLLLTSFPAGEGSDSAPLLTQLGLEADREAERMENAVLLLRRRVSVDVDRRTGVGLVQVQLHAPDVSAAVANETVALMNWYNRTTRQSQARERRGFAEERVREVGQRLEVLEDSLRRFYEANVQWENSPRLRFEESRLRRRVGVQEGLLTLLQQELESARIAEVNEAPVVSLVDPAVAPTRRSWPQRRRIVAATWFLSLMVILVAVSLYHYRDYLLAGDPDGIAALRTKLAIVKRNR
jgi:uncharacterized protein involved in exopolysaccharide biosynthesis